MTKVGVREDGLGARRLARRRLAQSPGEVLQLRVFRTSSEDQVRDGRHDAPQRRPHEDALGRIAHACLASQVLLELKRPRVPDGRAADLVATDLAGVRQRDVAKGAVEHGRQARDLREVLRQGHCDERSHDVRPLASTRRPRRGSCSSCVRRGLGGHRGLASSRPVDGVL